MSQVVDNKVAALLRAGQTTFENAEPNTGEGFQGWWPPEGEQDLFVVGVTEKAGKIKDEGGRDVECAEIQFEYEWIRDEKDPTWDKTKEPGPFIFKGRSFRLVANPDQNLISKGAQTGCRMDWDRFKGHLSRILDMKKEELGDVMARYAEAKAKIAGENRVAVEALIEYRQWVSKPQPGKPEKKGVEKKEYIKSLISG